MTKTEEFITTKTEESITTKTEEPITKRPLISSRELLLKAISIVMPLATIVMMAYFTTNTTAFLTWPNLAAILSQNAAVTVITVIFAMLLMSGYVDLSVGSVMGLSGTAAGLMMIHHGTWAGVLTGLGIGILFGLWNGVLIGVFGFSPIVVTLGGLIAARGIAIAIAPTAIYGFPAEFADFGSGTLWGLDYISWIALLIAAVAIVVMAATPFGKHVISIGVNPRASFLVGIRVKWTIFLLYLLTGAAVAIGALLLIARLDSAPSGSLGVGYETTILTAVLLGGVPFAGGRGNMWRVLLGVWFLAVLQNGLTLMNVNPQLNQIISGSVLVLAAGLQVLQSYLRKRI
jgi:ribose/xylose/arabinose/galactoside ABC-type transport system permease subunit